MDNNTVTDRKIYYCIGWIDVAREGREIYIVNIISSYKPWPSMNTGKCKRPKRICHSIGFIAVYGNVPTRRATTVSTSTLKYRTYRSFHRWFYERVSRNRSIKKSTMPISSRYCTIPSKSGLDKCVLPFIFCPNECRTTRFRTYMVTFVSVSRNVSPFVSWEKLTLFVHWILFSES